MWRRVSLVVPWALVWLKVGLKIGALISFLLGTLLIYRLCVDILALSIRLSHDKSAICLDQKSQLSSPRIRPFGHPGSDDMSRGFIARTPLKPNYRTEKVRAQFRNVTLQSRCARAGSRGFRASGHGFKSIVAEDLNNAAARDSTLNT